jgi:serine/threonine protein kinase
MSTAPTCDEDLVRRLPLPLAQLYRRAHHAKTPLERHLTAYYLWEAALKLLAMGAVIEYAERQEPDPQLAERLQSLARPALGHWWEFVRLLVPTLADAGDAGFQQARDLLLGRTRDDLPRAAGLDAALREAQGEPAGARATVRLSELFERLVRHRNRELGHGAGTQRPDEFHTRVGRALLAGVAEVLGCCDVLAGRRLVLVTDVRRQESGSWLVERQELAGASARPLPTLEYPEAAAARLPRPGRLHLEAAAAGSPPRCLHPLLIYDGDGGDVLFLNARRGQSRCEYLSYQSGRVIDRDDWAGERRALLGQALGSPVEPPQIEAWAARSRAEERAVAEPAAPPLRRLGEFEVLSKLGQGGMGVVYRAWQASLGRQVALKALLHSGDAKSEARFAREIRALGRVEHPNLVKVFTSGSDGDQWFYAMELLEGATLAAVCEKLQTRHAGAADLDLPTWQATLSTVCEESRRAETPLSDGPASRGRQRPEYPSPVADAPGSPGKPAGRSYVHHVVELVRQAAEAAHALHEAGVIHRDIKPGNVMVSADGSQAFLMDLGLAQLADEIDGKLTRTRQFVGTLRYASPEQVLAAGRVDRRSDVYSLGAMLWELLTLQRLFGATDQTATPELMQRIQYEEPGRLRRHNRRIPADLEAVVLKCLEKDPKRRYATAHELAADLQRFLAGEPVRARPAGWPRRTWRRLRRRPGVVLGILAGLLLLGAAAFGAWYWDTYRRKKIEYYAHFIMRRGAAEGVGRLTPAQAAGRALSWKVTRQGPRVQEVEAVNGYGRPASEQSDIFALIRRGKEDRRECRFVYRRNEQGDVVEQSALDRDGQVVWTFHFSTPTTGYYADQRGIPRARGGTGAAFVEFVWTADGLDQEVRFLDKDGRPQANDQGAFAICRQFDPHGEAVEEDYLDAAGQPTVIRDGYARVVRAYDEQGNQLEESYFGPAGNAVLCRAGYARWQARYDDRGNEVELAYFGPDGAPALTKELIARGTFAHDEHGNEVQRAFFDREGRLTAHKDGDAGWIAKVDGHGNQVEKTYLGLDGRAAAVRHGYARVARTFDALDHCTETAYFGADGRPARTKEEDVHEYTNTEDGSTHEGTIAILDEAGRPTMTHFGAHAWKAKSDDQGNIVAISYFGLDGNSVGIGPGITAVLHAYDEHGNEVEETRRDREGRLIRGFDGTAGWTAKYDDRGREVERAFFDEDRHPTWGLDGYTRYTSTYDDRGNRVGQAYFNTEGKPIVTRQGYASWSAAYDERGNQTAQAYFDAAGKPTLNTDGVARWVARYDERDNRIEEAYFGTDDRPILNVNGIAGLTAKYDERDNKVEEAYFGTDRRPIANKVGVAGWRGRCDARGNLLEWAYFDTAGRPVRHTDGNARVTRVYDDATGRLARETYSGYEGSRFASLVREFDARERKVSEGYHDAADRPGPGPDGYARFTSKYDDQDHEIERAFFDEADKLLRTKEGFARWADSYDERGRRTGRAFFDEAGNMVRGTDGYAGWTSRYDERRNEVERTYVDEAGHPVQTTYGYTRWKARYDPRGNVLETAYTDETDRPVRSKDGYARVANTYDERGYLTADAYFDVDDQPLRTEVRLTQITPGGRGEQLGLRVGDILRTYDGKEVTSASQFTGLRKARAGNGPPRELIVLRDGKPVTLTVPPGLLSVTVTTRVTPPEKPGTAPKDR